MSQLELQAYRLAKRRFKINRKKDLLRVTHASSRMTHTHTSFAYTQGLYDELRLPVQRTPQGRICLKKSYLSVLADQHPLPTLITEYRQVQSALDRCIDHFEQVHRDMTDDARAIFSSASTSRVNRSRCNVREGKLHGKLNVPTRTVTSSLPLGE